MTCDTRMDTRPFSRHADHTFRMGFPVSHPTKTQESAHVAHHM